MDNTIFKSNINITFSDAPEGTLFEIGVHQMHHANFTSIITTSDANTTIHYDEVITQPDQALMRHGLAAVVMTIKSADPDIKIVSAPTKSTELLTFNTDCVETDEGGVHTAIITVITEFPNDYNNHVYVDTTTMNETQKKPVAVQMHYLIMKQSLIEGKLHGQGIFDENMTVTEMFSMFNVTLVKVSDQIYKSLQPEWHQEEIIEIDEDTAKWGAQFFGEIRGVAKVWEAKNPWYGEKKPVELTDDIKNKVITVMKLFAVEIVEAEFERRFLAMRGASQLEAASWELQKHEAKEWLQYQGSEGSKTPFLDYLSVEHNKDKTELANKILTKAEEYEDKLSTMLVDMQKIIKQFKSCTTIWDINILYEDYMGIQMPIKQAIDLGRAVSETDWSRKPEWQVKGNGYYF